MSEAVSHISYGSQGSLGPDDSVSQVLPPYFCNNFQLDMEEENDDSAPSETLSSAPSGLLTATLDSHSISEDVGRNASGSSVVMRTNMSSMNLDVPSVFLPKRKARKGHCWLPSNGMEVFDNGKWRWRCARCKFCNLCYINYLKCHQPWLAQLG